MKLKPKRRASNEIRPSRIVFSEKLCGRFFYAELSKEKIRTDGLTDIKSNFHQFNGSAPDCRIDLSCGNSSAPGDLALNRLRLAGACNSDFVLVAFHLTGGAP